MSEEEGISSMNNSSINVDNLHLSDFETDDNGVVSTVQGVSLEELQAKQLRAIGSKLKIRGIRNAKKDSIVEAIKTTVSSTSSSTMTKAHYQAQLLLDKEDQRIMDDQVQEKTSKDIHSSFRLINVLFSDKFSEELSQLGTITSTSTSSTRTLSDYNSGKARRNDQHFWERVQSDFKSENEAYASLMFVDTDIVFAAQKDVIDPSKVTCHEWNTLRTIWMGIVADYNKACCVSRYNTLSATHDSDFFKFCHGKLELYYLRKMLKLKPNLVGYMEADLPAATFLDSSPAAAAARNPNNSDCSNNNNTEIGPIGKKRRKTNKPNKVIDAIQDFSNSRMQCEISKQRLFILQQEQQRKEKADLVKENYLKEKQERKQQESRYAEWERIQNSISKLRDELRKDGIDDETKRDIMEDIDGLKKRKNIVAHSLGLK